MKIFIIHLIITVTSAMLVKDYDLMPLTGLAEFGVYFLLFCALWLSSFLYQKRYFWQVIRSLDLLGYFIKELFVSNLEIVRFVLSRKLIFRPAILALPLDVRTDTEITLLANLITLTPGSLTLEISQDKKLLFFHVIHVADGDLEKVKQKIKNGFEKKILNINR